VPILLALPLGLALLVALWLVTLPLAVWQRYRCGRARRRVRGWALRLNAWSVLVSTALFLGGAWIAQLWIERALAQAAAGVLGGIAAGAIGAQLARVERDGGGLFHTPNRWLVLALTLVVAARIGYGLWHLPLWYGDATHAAWLARQGGLLAVGGLLLGHYLGYAWALRWRLAREADARRY
jgi:hypothetical protein